MKGGRRTGAGRPQQRRLTSDAGCIDLIELTREGRLTRQHRGYVVSYRGCSAEGWRDFQEALTLDWVPCRFGGERAFFLCPRCGRHCLTIYLYGQPACRYCACLAYPSQSEDALARAWRRVRVLQDRLGWGDGEVGGRPKGMRGSTFLRLHEACMRERRRKDELAYAVATIYLRGLGFTDV